MAERTKSLVFPAGGLNRQFSLQRQPPFTTADCLNVRPFDPLVERRRGGSRPGLEVFHSRDLLRTAPVNLLSSINVAAESNIIAFTDSDSFSGGVSAVWATWDLQGHPLGLINATTTDEGQARRFLPSNHHELSGYTVSCIFDTKQVDSANRRVFDGSGSLDLGLPSESAFPLNPPENWTRFAIAGHYDVNFDRQILQIFILHMTGSDVDEQFFNFYQTAPEEDEGSLVSIKLSATHIPGPPAQMRYELLIEREEGTSNPVASLPFTFKSGLVVGCSLQKGLGGFSVHPIVRDFKIKYFVANPPIFPTAGDLLVGASDGQITLLTNDGVLDRPTGQLDQKGASLMAVDALVSPYEGGPDGDSPSRIAGARLFIADYAIGSDGRTDTSVHPKIFDPTANRLDDWVADRYEDGTRKGAVPVGNTMIAVFLARVFLAGNPSHVWYASRINDPMDWDSGALIIEEDPSSSRGGTLEKGGASLNEPIRAMASYLDDYLVFATANSLYRLAGDPGFRSPILRISAEAGMAGPRAWCITPEGALVFLDQERGLFVLSPGGQSYPQALSAEVLPNELKNIDVQDTNVQLAYDHIKQGVHIILQSISGLDNDHWWYDRRTSGFWPLTLDSAHTPRVTFSFQGLTPSDSGVLLGGPDGVIRRFKETSGTDDGIVFNSHVVYGPFNLTSSDSLEGALNWIRATTESSGDEGLQFEIVTGRTALDALDENSQHRRVFTGRLDPEFMKRRMVRLRGVVAFVKIFGTQTPWAIETLDVGVEPLAPPRP